MKNGRLYNGDNGDEVAPVIKKLQKSEWTDKAPLKTTSIED
jgi:hypothetical protein